MENCEGKTFRENESKCELLTKQTFGFFIIVLIYKCNVYLQYSRQKVRTEKTKSRRKTRLSARAVENCEES